jgi:carboxymethylenebutenolidase
MQLTLPSGTPAELATPGDGRTPTRGLVIIPDIGGLRPLFGAMAQRIADERGWAACTFDVWGDLTPADSIAERLGQVGRLTDDRLLGDAVAAADACEVEPVGVIGFCMGGMYTFKAAGTGRFDRAAAFYGMIRVPEQWRSPGHGEPLDALARPGAAATLAVIAGLDQWTPPDDVAALAEAGVAVIRYDEADHGFAHDPDRPTHRAADAADAWQQALDFVGG